MRLPCLLSLAAIFAAGAAAHADTVTNFNILGASLSGDPNTVAGTVAIDVTNGIIESVSFTAGGVFESGVDSQTGPVVFVGADDAKLSFDAGSLIAFTGGAFDLNGPNDLYVGHVTLGSPAAPTAVGPEPSSLILLGTASLGFAGAMRRRISASNG